uniref:Rho GTPase activating protein 23 n=1 Tax=Mustela putorius furo TaxID=9669 RepID=M3YUM6_MUSPF
MLPLGPRDGCSPGRPLPWQGPRTLLLHKSLQDGFGFTLRHFIVYPPESAVHCSLKEEENGGRGGGGGGPSPRHHRLEPMDTIFVKNVKDDGPAHRAGLRTGDRLVKVNGESVIGKTYSQVIALIQNSDDTLELSIMPKDEDILQLAYSQDAYLKGNEPYSGEARSIPEPPPICYHRKTYAPPARVSAWATMVPEPLSAPPSDPRSPAAWSDPGPRVPSTTRTHPDNPSLGMSQPRPSPGAFPRDRLEDVTAHRPWPCSTSQGALSQLGQEGWHRARSDDYLSRATRSAEALGPGALVSPRFERCGWASQRPSARTSACSSRDLPAPQAQPPPGLQGLDDIGYIGYRSYSPSFQRRTGLLHALSFRDSPFGGLPTFSLAQSQASFPPEASEPPRVVRPEPSTRALEPPTEDRRDEVILRQKPPTGRKVQLPPARQMNLGFGEESPEPETSGRVERLGKKVAPLATTEDSLASIPFIGEPFFCSFVLQPPFLPPSHSFFSPLLFSSLFLLPPVFPPLSPSLPFVCPPTHPFLSLLLSCSLSPPSLCLFVHFSLPSLHPFFILPFLCSFHSSFLPSTLHPTNTSVRHRARLCALLECVVPRQGQSRGDAEGVLPGEQMLDKGEARVERPADSQVSGLTRGLCLTSISGMKQGLGGLEHWGCGLGLEVRLGMGWAGSALSHLYPPLPLLADEPTSPSIDLQAKHVPASAVVSSAMNSAPVLGTSPSSPTFTFALGRHYSQDCSSIKAGRRSSYLLAITTERSKSCDDGLNTFREESRALSGHYLPSVVSLQSLDSWGTSEDADAPSKRHSTSDLSDATFSDIRREGWLYYKQVLTKKGKKAGGGLRQWKRVYAALRARSLSLSKERREPGPAAAGAAAAVAGEDEAAPVCIGSCLVDISYSETKRRHVFRLTTADFCEYLFQAEDRDDMLGWIRAIRENSRAEGEDPGCANQALISKKLNDYRKVSHSSGPKDDSSPKISRGLGGLKSEFLKQSTARGLRTQDQPAGSKDDSAAPPKTPWGINIIKKNKKAAPRAFGVRLEECQPAIENQRVPLIVAACCRIVEARGLESTGIYRVPGNNAVVSSLQEQLNRGPGDINLQDERWQDLNVISSLLKSFFRKLPEPLFTDDKYNDFIEANRIEDSRERLKRLRKLIRDLPGHYYETLKFLVGHLKTIADHSEKNKMEPRNLALVFGPTLVRTSEDNMADMVTHMPDRYKIVETLIQHSDWFFSDDEDKGERTPVDDKEPQSVPNIEYLLPNIGRTVPPGDPGSDSTTCSSAKSKGSWAPKKEPYAREMLAISFISAVNRKRKKRRE